MRSNIGNVDKFIRLFAGIALADLSFDQALGGHWNILTITLSILLLATALTGFCPLYSIFGSGHKHNTTHE